MRASATECHNVACKGQGTCEFGLWVAVLHCTAGVHGRCAVAQPGNEPGSGWDRIRMKTIYVLQSRRLQAADGRPVYTAGTVFANPVKKDSCNQTG